MHTSEQYAAALEVLKGMKACIDINDTYCKYNGKSVNLHLDFGICWHVFSGTRDHEINQRFFHEAFEEMGLSCSYPVEFSLGLTEKDFYGTRNKYDPSTEIGQARIKLMNDLIQYCENKIK